MFPGYMTDAASAVPAATCVPQPTSGTTDELTMADAVVSGLSSVRFPASPGQFEQLYMDMAAMTAQQTTNTAYTHWGDKIVNASITIKKEHDVDEQEEVEDESADSWDVESSPQPPPSRPRRGRAPMNDERVCFLLTSVSIFFSISAFAGR